VRKQSQPRNLRLEDASRWDDQQFFFRFRAEISVCLCVSLCECVSVSVLEALSVETRLQNLLDVEQQSSSQALSKGVKRGLSDQRALQCNVTNADFPEKILSMWKTRLFPLKQGSFVNLVLYYERRMQSGNTRRSLWSKCEIAPCWCLND